ncbi:hypothetical protein ACOMHN_005501 [Nucella lapillus]
MDNSKLSEEQKRRIEKNKRRALAKRQEKLGVGQPSPQPQRSVPFQKQTPALIAEGSSHSNNASTTSPSLAQTGKSAGPGRGAGSHRSQGTASTSRFRAAPPEWGGTAAPHHHKNQGAWLSKANNNNQTSDQKSGAGFNRWNNNQTSPHPKGGTGGFNKWTSKQAANQKTGIGKAQFYGQVQKPLKGQCVLISRDRFEVNIGFNEGIVTAFKTISSKNYVKAISGLKPAVQVEPLPKAVLQVFGGGGERGVVPQADLSQVDSTLVDSLMPFQREGVKFFATKTFNYGTPVTDSQSQISLTMAEASLPRPKMDWNSPDKAQAIRDFKQLCELWFMVKTIDKPAQYTYIMLWLGTEGLRLFNTWGLTEEELQDPKNIWDKFAQLEPADNFRIHRLELQRLSQRQGESVEDFLIRLKEKALRCRYGDTTSREERILKQLIAGTNIAKVQRELLAKDDKLTLQQAVEIAKTYKATEQHMKQLQELHTPSSSVDAVSKTPQPSHKPCGNCGGTHAPRQCPALGTTCSGCGKPNHWKRVCRSTANGQRHAGFTGRQQFSRGGHRNGYGHQQGAQRFRGNVHEISQSDELNLETLVFDSISKHQQSATDNRDELYAHLDMQYHQPASLKVKVDTGAQGNILPLRIFRQMFPEELDKNGFPKSGSTKPRPTVLQAYNGTPIQQHGVRPIICRYGSSEWHYAEFFVAESDGPAILGLPSSRELRLVTIHCSVNTKTGTPSMKKPPTIQDANDLQKLYPDSFKGIGHFPGELHITLQEGARPVIQPPRKYPVQLLDEIKAELEKMENLDVITPVTEPTDWVNALAFSRKQSGGLRVCLDPRALNKCIKRTHHKTPTLEEITNRLSGSTVFSKLDAKHGYWSIELDHESSLLTTFNSPCGRYRFKRLPFGLNLAQDAFQQCMDSILSQCPGTIGITDDIIVHGKNTEEHNRNLRHLMKVAEKSGLVFNAEKCSIKTPKIKFFGMIYDAEGVHPDPEKCDEIQAVPAPQNVTEVQQFLSIIQYLSPFIPNLSDQTAPLRALTKKDAHFEWNNSLQQAFDRVKSTVCKDMSLQYFNVNKPSVIQVDASKTGLGAALLQDGKPIAFASKALTDSEQRYANIERELLAVVFGCERFHTYVFGKEFVVETDHKPLEQIHKKSLASTSPRLQRMMLRLQQYDIQIQYRPGREMTLADSLSRLNPRPDESISLEQAVYAVQFSTSRLEELQQKTDADSELSKLKDVIIEGWPDNAKELPKNLRDYWSCRDEMSVQDGLVMKGERIVVPQAMQRYILQNIHAGHQGSEKCKLRAKTCVFWRGISADIDATVRYCNLPNPSEQPAGRDPLPT